MLSRRTILLRPMRAAVSGYARLQTENGRTLAQLHARGLSAGEVCLFGYLPERTMRQLGSVSANAHGEASLEVTAPTALQALILVDATPAPLLICLCDDSHAGALLDVKNAALALCERLKQPKASQKPIEPTPIPRAEKPPPPSRHSSPPALPREIFLPAIDPAPYTSAVIREPAQEEAILPPPKPIGPPADRLRALQWPRGFETLKGYFDAHLPRALFALPGWRFICVSQDLWIGYQAQDDRVRRIAYAYRNAPPPDLQARCQPMQGLDGNRYQVLWMKI